MVIHIEYSSVIIAAFAAFIFSFIYYAILNKKIVVAREKYVAHNTETKMTTPKIAIEFVRTFILALFVAYAVTMLNFLYIQQALLLAFWLWLAFPVVLLVGSVMHERFPRRLAVIHAVDWLAKLLIICIILTYWR